MNTKVIKDTIEGSFAGTLTFPQVVGKLLAEGVESYHVDLVRGENRYYLPTGESHVETVRFDHPRAAEKFSASRVEAAIRQIQAGKLTYPQFLNLIIEAGTVCYVAYLVGKRVTYFGREGDFYTEYFPGANPGPGTSR